MRQQRGVCRNDHDNRPVRTSSVVTKLGQQITNLTTHRYAGDRKSFATTIITLDENADRITVDPARRRPDPAFEPVANHAGSAANSSLRHGSSRGRVQRLESMFLANVESVDVVERPIVSFCDYGKSPPDAWDDRTNVFLVPHPLNHRIPDDADAMCIRYQDRTFEEAGFLHPRRARHFSVPVQRVPTSEHG